LSHQAGGVFFKNARFLKKHNYPLDFHTIRKIQKEKSNEAG